MLLLSRLACGCLMMLVMGVMRGIHNAARCAGHARHAAHLLVTCLQECGVLKRHVGRC